MMRIIYNKDSSDVYYMVLEPTTNPTDTGWRFTNNSNATTHFNCPSELEIMFNKVLAYLNRTTPSNVPFELHAEEWNHGRWDEYPIIEMRMFHNIRDLIEL